MITRCIKGKKKEVVVTASYPCERVMMCHRENSEHNFQVPYNQLEKAELAYEKASMS